MKRLTIAMLGVMCFLGPVALAKREMPKKVIPVVHNGIRYEAPNYPSRVVKVEAWDDTKGDKIWEQSVYEVKIDPKLEEDVQWNFITSLAIENGEILVRTEHRETYGVDLKSRVVTKKAKPAKQPGKHIIEPGESLSGIAIRYGVTIGELSALNNIQDPDKIVAGQELLLPVPKKAEQHTTGIVLTAQVATNDTFMLWTRRKDNNYWKDPEPFEKAKAMDILECLDGSTIWNSRRHAAAYSQWDVQPPAVTIGLDWSGKPDPKDKTGKNRRKSVTFCYANRLFWWGDSIYEIPEAKWNKIDKLLPENR